MSIKKLLIICFGAITAVVMVCLTMVSYQLQLQERIVELANKRTAAAIFIYNYKALDQELILETTRYILTGGSRHQKRMNEIKGYYYNKVAWPDTGKKADIPTRFLEVISENNFNTNLLKAIEILDPSYFDYIEPAIKAAQGEFRDSEGKYTIHGEPDIEQAKELILNPALFQIIDDGAPYIEKMLRTAEKEIERDIAAAIDTATNNVIVTIILMLGCVALCIFMYWMLRRQVLQPVEHMVGLTYTLSKGDLTVERVREGEDEIGRFGQAFNCMVRDMGATFGMLNEMSHQISVNCASVCEKMGSTRSKLNAQQRDNEQVASAITEMAASAEEIAKNCMSTADKANATTSVTLQGLEVVNNAITTMNHLSSTINDSAQSTWRLVEHAEKVSNVLDVIQGIAAQTNLLALNAAIEAARAGEQGRGFAVVADEVRTLARRTQDYTNEIKSTIEQLQQGVSESVKIMNASSKATDQAVTQIQEAGTALATITTSIQEMSGLTSSIATATEQQTFVANEISGLIEKINTHSVESNDLSKHALEDTSLLEEAAKRLAQKVDAVKLA